MSPQKVPVLSGAPAPFFAQETKKELATVRKALETAQKAAKQAAPLPATSQLGASGSADGHRKRVEELEGELTEARKKAVILERSLSVLKAKILEVANAMGVSWKTMKEAEWQQKMRWVPSSCMPCPSLCPAAVPPLSTSARGSTLRHQVAFSNVRSGAPAL